MADYITPVGGGYYFIPRAAAGLRRLGRLRHVHLTVCVCSRYAGANADAALLERVADRGQRFFDAGAVDVEVGDGADAAFEEAHFDARGGELVVEGGRRGRRR